MTGYVNIPEILTVAELLGPDPATQISILAGHYGMKSPPNRAQCRRQKDRK